MFDERKRYVIKDYQNQPPFSSFLPGIAGETGIPVWCYYNNRGQAVCSFGAQDKDHAIMEFSPAHVAYRDVNRTGFRTFCKVNGQFIELFTENCNMHIGMSDLEIRCKQKGLSGSARYFGVPEERTAALVRVLTVTNSSSETIRLELLDGMSAIVPYGLNQDFLKNMTQLAKAWMQAEDFDSGRAYFRVRASLEDGAIVREVKGGNFCLGWDEQGSLLKPIVQSSLIFGQDTSLSSPKNFICHDLNHIAAQKQVASNQFPCCFLAKSAVLASNESITLYSIYGQAESKHIVAQQGKKIQPKIWFNEKYDQAVTLTQSITAPIACRTGDPVFDAYAKQTYLDNALRGGAPIVFKDGEKTVPFHIYSRKHGDPEREYNYFSLGKEYYAQGNGNYRDVNQNRRCDCLFAPEIGTHNIFTFFDLIQTDGYNPLVIMPNTYTLSDDDRSIFVQMYPQLDQVLSGFFTPGQLAMVAQDLGMDTEQISALTAKIICASQYEPNANFGEGYWSDHWTYNLDLIESYLSIYPERKEELLFTEHSCRWYDTQVFVNPRYKRYTMTENGLRQYFALDEGMKKSHQKWMHTKDGNQASSSLMEKILLLCAIKTATLDAGGMGIEMEGGRPGWYDALNGLPGLLGSSMAESCELARLLDFTAKALEQYSQPITLYQEVVDLLSQVTDILHLENDLFKRWDALNVVKELYREKTMYGFNGKRAVIESNVLVSKIRSMQDVVLSGIAKAMDLNGGLLPTYFTYTATETQDNMPKALVPTPLPLFLEGPVRYMKLPMDKKAYSDVARKVKKSNLYDKKLRMFKVNDSLSKVSYEAGRALAFTPGWLENESVWLHMEYKYLLELLKNGLYTEFAEAFHDAAVPFLNPSIYGRSPLENVSFIASSANPDDGIHGRGFVARLSGSTAEFIHMWYIMFFGKKPFQYQNDKLQLSFEPFIPTYLMRHDGILKATFLGKISVIYHTGTLTELIPGITSADHYVLHYLDGTQEVVEGSVLYDKYAHSVRDGLVTTIDVYMK